MPKKSAALLSVRELENFKMTSVMGQFLCQCFLSFCCLPIFLVADVTLPILTFVRDQPDYELSAALPRIGGRPNKCFARLLNVRDRSLAMLSIVQVQGAFFYFIWSEGFANLKVAMCVLECISGGWVKLRAVQRGFCICG